MNYSFKRATYLSPSDNSFEHLKEEIKNKRNCELTDCSINYFINRYVFNSTNENKVEVKQPCGHLKVCTIKTLFRGSWECIDCNSLKWYQYDSFTKEKTCKECNFVHKDVSPVHVYGFICYNCIDETKPESQFAIKMKENGYPLLKCNNNRGIKGDFFFVDKDGNDIVFEVDTVKCSYAVNSFLTKDKVMIKRDKTKLIRLYKDDIDDFVKNIDVVLKKLKETTILLYVSSESSGNFYQRIYGSDKRDHYSYMSGIKEKEETEEEE